MNASVSIVVFLEVRFIFIMSSSLYIGITDILG